MSRPRPDLSPFAPEAAGMMADALQKAREQGRRAGLVEAERLCWGVPVECREERDQLTRDRTRKAIADYIRSMIDPPPQEYSEVNGERR